MSEDYFLKGNFESKDKFVLIEGFIDKKKGIIYEAKFISALSDDEIVEAIEYVRNAKEKLTRETVRDIVLGILQWETIGDFNASDG